MSNPSPQAPAPYLLRMHAELRGHAYWYPALVDSCKARGVTLIEDKYWRGLAGEYRAGIQELPGHVLVLTPGRLQLDLALVRLPTRMTVADSTLEHTSDPARLAKSGIDAVWLWSGILVHKFVDAVHCEIQVRLSSPENFFCTQNK